ncbi:MAG TPA: M48 family metallopeptidase [Planctomycetota bacterium]|nr:M48 family metallopeptidase [Planctomycetota bacterium]
MTALAEPAPGASLFGSLFVATLLVSAGLRIHLSRRQERHVRAHREEVPSPFRGAIPLEAHRKAADYAVARTRFSRVAAVWDAVALVALTLGGGLDALARLLPGATLLGATAFVLAAFLARGLLLLPLSAWRTFRIEQRFGFNRTTPRLFALDLAKGLLLAGAIGAPLVLGGLWLVARAGRFWWLYAWAGWFLASVLLAWAYPVLIAPLFNRFRRLEDEALAGRIRALLDRTGFRSGGIRMMDGSRRSTHANAYFTGLGRKKQVVFFDTLRELLTPDEMEAVLAHELGHFKLRHVQIRLAVGATTSLAGFALLGWLLGRGWFFEGLGVTTPSPQAGLVLFALAAPAFDFVLHPLLTAWSRRQEYEADAFAAAHASADAMALALVKLTGHNAATLTPDPLHSAFHDTHPPAPLRIARLKASPQG